MNRVCLTGRLTDDLEIRATPSGANVTSFTIAVDNFAKDQQGNTVKQASFINCVAWNQSATFLATYCRKGSLIAVDGRLQTRSYDRKDGTKAYVTEVICDRVENLSPKQEPKEEPLVNQFADTYSEEDLPF